MHADSGDISPPAETAGLYCPNCDYDLTGLTEDRCRECGEAFDRGFLRKMAAGEPLPAVPWDTDRTVRGFIKTWWLALSDRGRLAANFPPRHDTTMAWWYSAICYAFVWIGLFCYFVHSGDIVQMCIIIPTVSVLSCYVCEMLTAAGLAWLAPPRNVRKRYHFWRGLTHYTGGYAWLSLIWAWLATVTYDPSMKYGPDGLYQTLSAVVLFLWWSSGFCVMARRRGSSWFRIGLAWVWVVIAGGASILLGYGLSVILVYNMIRVL